MLAQTRTSSRPTIPLSTANAGISMLWPPFGARHMAKARKPRPWFESG